MKLLVEWDDVLAAANEAYQKGKKDAMQWQPIETAPKVENQLILGCDKTGMLAIIEYCSWMDENQWSVYHDAEDYAWQDYKPIYWMPLPCAPEES